MQLYLNHIQPTLGSWLMHITLASANRLSDIGDLNVFIRFLHSTADLTAKRLGETITTRLMERGCLCVRGHGLAGMKNMSMNIRITLNEWLWICFSFTFNYESLLSTSEVSIKTPEPSQFDIGMKSLWKHRHTSCLYNIFSYISPRWERTRSWLVKGKLGKLRWMGTGFRPVSISAQRLLPFLHFNK